MRLLSTSLTLSLRTERFHREDAYPNYGTVKLLSRIKFIVIIRRMSPPLVSRP